MGDLYALLSALCWAAANVTIARGAPRSGGDNGAFLSILLTLAMAAAIWVSSGLAHGWPRLSTIGAAWFALAGALTIFIGRVFLHSSIQWLGAMRGSSVKRLVPLFSVVMGVALLGDPLSVVLVAGMLLIFAGFALLVFESGRHGDPTAPKRRRWANPGIVYGAVSALAYAAGNVARKYGLIDMPDPAFGAMLGSLVGALLFVVTSAFAGGYRDGVRSTFTRWNPWLTGAGLLTSAGQLLFFVAIDHGTVSRAALIVSSEAFLTMGLSLAAFRGRERLTSAATIAAALGMLGTIVIMLDPK
jgi:drug/metabolite transporter (DMT)-like permease